VFLGRVEEVGLVVVVDRVVVAVWVNEGFPVVPIDVSYSFCLDFQEVLLNLWLHQMIVGKESPPW